jgi:hypothetical protein
MSPDTPTFTAWTLVLHPNHTGASKDIWTFRTTVSIHEMVTSDKNNIQVFRNGFEWQDDHVNGYYPMAEARTLWNNLIHKGYKPQE